MAEATPRRPRQAGLPPLIGNAAVYRRAQRDWSNAIVVAAIPVLILLFFGDWVTVGFEWAVLLAFAAFCLVIVLAGDRVMVVADDEGIAARDWGWLKIKWADIQDIRVDTRRLTGTVLALDLRNPDQYLAQMSGISRWSRRLNQRLAGAPFTFNPDGLTASPDQIAAKIRRHLHPSG